MEIVKNRGKYTQKIEFNNTRDEEVPKNDHNHPRTVDR